MLRFTDYNLKLISDIEKYQFVESMISGTISMICKGYAKGNNKSLKLYDSDKPISYILYLDANNLYGHSVVQSLPAEKLDWVSPDKFNPDNYSNNSSVGFFLEADLDCPAELNDMHNDYPLAVVKIKVTKEILLIKNRRR